MGSQSLPTRNTLNQRASRQRRQLYISDLERRVHAYETQGVHATAEVQSAARKVSVENQTLREEIEVLRKRCAALEQYIESGTFVDGLSRKTVPQAGGVPRSDGRQRRRRTKTSLEKTATKRTTTIAESSHHEPGEGILPNDVAAEEDISTSPYVASSVRTAALPPTTTREGHDVLYDQEPAGMTNIDLSTSEDSIFWPPSESGTTAPDYLTPSSTEVDSPHRTPSPTPCRPATAPNTTPCLEAALIIASMRGLAPDDTIVEGDILPRLGCLVSLGRPRCPPAQGGGHTCASKKQTQQCGSAANLAFETAMCAVDNGTLMGILAQEG